MQRIMIVSDSHRRHGNLAEAIYNEQPFDLLIHLGDIEGEEDIIQELAGGETIMVPGNNDFFSPLPREREIELAGKKVLLTSQGGITYTTGFAGWFTAIIIMFLLICRRSGKSV